MARPKRQTPLKPLQILIPPDWYDVLARYATSNETNVTEIMRPHVKKVVDAIQTMKAA